jgi:hypothetical protein
MSVFHHEIRKPGYKNRVVFRNFVLYTQGFPEKQCVSNQVPWAWSLKQVSSRTEKAFEQ